MASLRLPVAPPPQQQQVQDPAQHIDVRASQSTTPTPRPLTKRPRIEQYYEPGEPLRVPSPKLEPHSTAQGGELGKQGKYMAIAPQRVPQVDQTSVATVSDPIRTLVDVHVAPARMQLEAGKASSDHSFDFAYHADLRIGLDKAVEAIDKDALKHTTFNEGAFDMSIECRSTDLITSLDMAALATFFDAFVSSPIWEELGLAWDSTSMAPHFDYRTRTCRGKLQRVVEVGRPFVIQHEAARGSSILEVSIVLATDPHGVDESVAQTSVDLCLVALFEDVLCRFLPHAFHRTFRTKIAKTLVQDRSVAASLTALDHFKGVDAGQERDWTAEVADLRSVLDGQKGGLSRSKLNSARVAPSRTKVEPVMPAVNKSTPAKRKAATSKDNCRPTKSSKTAPVVTPVIPAPIRAGLATTSETVVETIQF